MTVTLSKEKFEKAKSFLQEQGRMLDQLQFDFYFQNGSKEDVIEALMTHQNSDGGFQGMGEGSQDSSSPIGTSVAFQLLTELNVPSDDLMVQKGVKYIIETFDPDMGLWQPAFNWIHEGENVIQKWENPSAELVGYLYHYQDLVPSTFLKKLIDITTNNLMFVERPMDAFVLLCYMRLSKFSPEPLKGTIIQRLREDVPRVIEVDPNKWSSWCIKPYWFAISTTSPFGDIIKQDLVRNLEYEIQNQTENGFFPPHWHDTEDNLKIWRSILTIDVLKALRSYKMIDS